MNQVYRTLKIRLPHRLVKERANVLDLAVRKLKELAQWYGIPYLEERLHSTVCPRCGAKMVEEKNRIMRCLTCGFSDNRDNIPIVWAKKLYNIKPLL
ncbi:transposase, IS605 OrfB [Pyrobaculum islandicum DSM 4184]|uniref:Transposase, IS605 OrfB n=1 Tax=Pyrobaculum islandicum (strain DSM 4184 / JCM 9189 / GEO3) TaxID=384616 RepID=A1RTC2_PYRIL|nr:transposase, IS605 OrfB [Pyrobaculum islandicum DSM 4184]